MNLSTALVACIVSFSLQLYRFQFVEVEREKIGHIWAIARLPP
jgi:hypothetical protein